MNQITNEQIIELFKTGNEQTKEFLKKTFPMGELLLKKEITDTLVSEARIRGLVPGNVSIINPIHTIHTDTLNIPSYFRYEQLCDKLWIDCSSGVNICIFDKGKWATLKEEAPQELAELVKQKGKESVIKMINEL